MKKGIALLVLVFFAGILMVASSQSGMAWLTSVRYSPTSILHSDKYTYGDLYGISYFPEFKKYKDTLAVQKPVLSSNEKDLELYVVGDSYFYSSFKLDPDYFERAKSLQFYKWDHQPVQPVELSKNPTRKVLLVESVERNVLNLVKLDNIKSVFDGRVREKSTSGLDKMNSVISDWLYHPTLEANLSFALFDISIFSGLKEWKSKFNQAIFGRSPVGVTLAKTKDFLYLEQTVDPNATGSSFKPVRDDEYRALIHEMGLIQSYARTKGFDDVIFTYIPNPSSVLLTEGKPYNQFVPTIASMSQSKFLFIDPTNLLRVNANQNFFRNDSHWNPKGAKIWLDLSNQLLLRLPKK
ncbi:MAG: hypothetical protein RL638_452 [Bacteroidota bacterium]|jgi:hypothetical protein